jgi:hypothetical protein
MWKSAASGFSPNPPANAPGDGNGGGSNYMEGGINNPSIFLYPNGTSLIAARTCTWPEQVVVASAPHWRGPYKSVVDGPAFGGNPNPSDEVRRNGACIWFQFSIRMMNRQERPWVAPEKLKKAYRFS